MRSFARGRHPWAVAVCGFGSVVVSLASFVLFSVSGVAQADSSTTTVSFNVLPVIEVLSWPSATLSLSGPPDTEVVTGPLQFRVRANAPWGLAVTADLNAGQMQEYDPVVDDYVEAGRVLTHPLEWAPSSDGPWSPIQPGVTRFASSIPPTGVDGRTVEFYLRQPITFKDMPLPAGREYRIVLTYTAVLDY